MSHVFEQVNTCQIHRCFRDQNVHETLSRPSPKILSFLLKLGIVMQRENEKSSTVVNKEMHTIKMNVSQSLFVLLIIKCIMKPHFAKVSKQGNFELVIIAAYVTIMHTECR
jgi:hypothetical protein